MADARTSQAPLGHRAVWGRLALAHLLTYPLLLWVAMATMSLSIVARRAALLAAEGQTEPEGAVQRWLVGRVGLGAAEAASFELIMAPVLVGLAAMAVVTHLAAVPWALAAGRHARGLADEASVRRAFRGWLLVSLVPAGVAVLAGLVGWAVIVLGGRV
jgi:hypothetical protein